MKKGKGFREETGIDSEKTQNGKASDQEDHFRRMPEELFVSILTIVADLKSLCKCSLVSKHFASVVFRVRTVFLTNPSSGAHSKEPFKVSWPLVFLENFRELESIYLEYKYLESSGNSAFFKWKIKFSCNGAKLEKFVSLLLLSAPVHKENEIAIEPHQVQNIAKLLFLWSHLEDWIGISHGCGRYAEWMSVVSMLSKSHTSLKRVTVADSAKQGKMVTGEEQLVRIRSLSEPIKLERFQHPQAKGLAVASIPVLHLPLSGYVMKRVRLVIFNFPTESSASILLGEAIQEIYKNHRDKIETRRVS